MISRRRVRFVLEMLGNRCLGEEKLSNVFTQIGLPIGGESRQEIALSIAADNLGTTDGDVWGGKMWIFIELFVWDQTRGIKYG